MHRITRRFAVLVACVVGLAGASAVGAPPKNSEDNVKFTVKADKPVDGKQVVTLTLQVEKGWHLYANPVGNAGLTSAQTTVTFSADGKAVPAKIEYPEGKLEKDDVVGDYKVYEGTVTIKATIDRPATGAVQAEIALQCCNDKTCLLPSKVKLKVD
jgi:DsbC/DsbD-like thiol-disulfide interchange protein